MISEIELKEKARTFKVPISSIERDYAQSWLLAHLLCYRTLIKALSRVSKKIMLNTF